MVWNKSPAYKVSLNLSTVPWTVSQQGVDFWIVCFTLIFMRLFYYLYCFLGHFYYIMFFVLWWIFHFHLTFFDTKLVPSILLILFSISMYSYILSSFLTLIIFPSLEALVSPEIFQFYLFYRESFSGPLELHELFVYLYFYFPSSFLIHSLNWLQPFFPSNFWSMLRSLIFTIFPFVLQVIKSIIFPQNTTLAACHSFDVSYFLWQICSQ